MLSRLLSLKAARGVLAVAILTVAPTAALAHAILVGSSPSANGTVVRGAVRFELHFNSRIDGARSRITLNLASDTDASHPLAVPPPTQPAPETLVASASLVPGAYVLHWIVLADDGHITRGQIPFTVR